MAKNTVGKPLSEKDEMYREFFRPLIHTMTKTHGFPSSSTPEDKNYRGFRNELRIKTGLPGVRYVLVFAQIKEFSVDIFIDRDKEWNEWLIGRLEERKESIESKLGETLEWMPLPHGNASRIRLYSGWRCRIDDHPENLRKVREWMIDRLVAFNWVFGPMFDELSE